MGQENPGFGGSDRPPYTPGCPTPQSHGLASPHVQQAKVEERSLRHRRQAQEYGCQMSDWPPVVSVCCILTAHT